MKRSHISILVAAGIFVCGAAYLRMRTFVDPKPPSGPNTRVLLAMVRSAIRMHELDAGRLPAKLEDLIEKPDDVVRWRGPYIESTDFADFWGNRIRYAPGQSNQFDLVSSGPDETFGTEDDITNHTPVKKGRSVNWGGGI
jgi:hypothetical protein